MADTPKIRFKGFVDAWEQRKLGEIAGNVIGGGTPKTSVAEYWDGSIPWIQSSNVQENEMFEFEIPKSITQIGLDKSAAKLIPKNSIAVVTHVGVGKLVFVPFSYATSQDFTSLAELKTDAKFTCYSLYQRIQNDLHIVQGSAIKGITKEDLLTKEIMVPEIEEQKKIGKYFSTLDHLITLHQHKCDETKELKRYMLQKMFPRNGKKNPEIRFAGFTDDWEQRKLGEICEVTMGQSPDGSTYSDEPSDYILVQGNADLKDGWVFPRIWTTQKTKTAQAGDLIMSVRAPAGAMGKTAHDVVLGRGVAGIKGNEFVYQTLVKFDSDGYWKKLAAGSTFESVNSVAVKGAILLVPQDVEEQEKIGAYFMHLDHLITLHQRKCDELKEVRKFMLQNMFPQKG